MSQGFTKEATIGGGGTSDHDALTGVSVDDHHSETHVVDSTGPHTGSGLTAGHVLRATSATAFSFGQAAHTDLGTVGIDDHHARDHTLVGSTHTASGLTTGHVLQATGATTFAFASGDGLDGTAIHDNVAAEISALTEKTTPVGADKILIEDSAAGHAKKYVQITNLPGGGSSPLTTKGDIFVYSTTDTRLPVGTNGQILESRSTEATGLRWVAAPSGTIPSPAADDEMLFPNTALNGWTSERFMLNVCSDEFGADPTGTSDSAAAFREAIDWLDTNRGGFGTIYVPEGHYNFTTTEVLSIRGVNRNVHVHVHEGIHILGAGFGSGRSQAAGDNQLAPTTIRSTSGTPYAIFAMHATGDVPDWRGASIRQLHIKDDSASNNAVDHAILVSGGLIYAHIENVSISNIEKSTGWPIRWVRANNNQPSQYGRITDVIISRSYNGIWLDGNAPDMIMTRVSALRDGLTAGNGTGALIESSKVTIRDSEFQFYDINVDIGNASDNRGKHILLDNVHLEGDQSEPSNTYTACLRMTGTAGQDELPVFRDIDIGNGSKFSNFFVFDDVYNFRIRDCRIRDSRHLLPTDSKISMTDSTGTVDGVSVLGTGQAGLPVDSWAANLFSRPSGETVHANDDNFATNTSGNYTAVNPTGSVTWTHDAHLLSAKFNNQSASDVGAYLKSLTPSSAPVTIETVTSLLGYDENFNMAGLVFSDGTTASSNAIAFVLDYNTTQEPVLRVRHGTLTNMATVGGTDLTAPWVWGARGGGLYMRLIWTAANTFEASFSVDGVSWKTDWTSVSDTLTPTHCGLAVSKWGGSIQTLATFDYLRVTESDLS